MNGGNEDLRELLATARAIYFAMRHSAISYQEAKDRTKPLLQKINVAIKVIAKEYNQRPKFVKFQSLGRNL